MNQLIKIAHKACFSQEVTHPDFKVGDTINVHVKIKEKNKERIQQFQGIVIKCKGATPSSKTFTVRRVASGIGMERIFPLLSPSIAKIELIHRGIVCRSKLFYLRDREGNAAKVKRKLPSSHT